MLTHVPMKDAFAHTILLSHSRATSTVIGLYGSNLGRRSATLDDVTLTNVN